ncbi:hypothetical protein BKA93DRAFT_752418 [Sparassis latifolia]
MGRPLFSSTHIPAVRVETEHEPEPAPAHPAYEKWSYWKPFDPDADEFFENDDAVYEAFIDPAQLPPAPRAPGLYFERSSSTGSESSGGGSTSDVDAVSVEELEVASSRRELRPVRLPSEWQVLPTYTLEVPEEPHAYEPGEMVSQYANMYNIVGASASTVSTTSDSSASASPAPRERSPPPAPRMYERAPTDIEYPASPSDEPMLARASQPSPGGWFEGEFERPQEANDDAHPATLPMMPELVPVYDSDPDAADRPTTPVRRAASTWRQRLPAYTSPAILPSQPLYSGTSIFPVRASPLTNRSARRSVAHITPTPALVPMHRAVF